MEASQVERLLEVMPPVIRDWILSVAKPDEITDLHYSLAVLDDGQLWKRGPHTQVATVTQNLHVDKQTFEKSDITNEWAPVGETSTITWNLLVNRNPQKEEPMASNGQQGKAGTPRGQYAMNSGKQPPRGVSEQQKSVKGADAKLPKHNAGVKNAKSKSSPKS